MIKIIYIIWYFIFNMLLYNQCVDKYDMLEKAYNNNSQEELIEFLNLWAKQYPPILENERKDRFKFEKEAYKIAEIFYNTKNLKLKGAKINWTDTVFANRKYQVIKSDIEILIIDIDTKFNYRLYRFQSDNLPNYIIKNFRPDINNFIELYYKYPYNYYLKYFLGGDFNKDGFIKFSYKEDELNKIEFLNKQLYSMYESHWGVYWHIFSEPYIDKIVFNSDYTRAYVYFRIEYKGGLTYFIKKQDQWEILKSELIWMQ